MANFLIRKAEIQYNNIDKGIRKTVKLLNKFPFLITTSSCEGHPSMLGDSHWVADGYITLEVKDEEKFLKMLKEIAPAFYQTTNHPLNVSKQYTFGETGDFVGEFHWRISYWFGYETKKEVVDSLRKCQRSLERLIWEYQRRHKDVLVG